MENIKIIRFINIASLYFLLAFCSCHKSPNSVSIGAYPNKVGDAWTYYVQDSLDHINDTLTVTVVSSGVVNGTASLLWQYAYSNGMVDTLQAIISGDTIIYDNNTALPSQNFDILFPIINGADWTYSSYARYSTSYVGGFSYLSYNFSDVYLVNHIEAYPNYSLSDEIYITPGVGLVHRRIHENNFGPTIYQIWTLINYHLN